MLNESGQGVSQESGESLDPDAIREDVNRSIEGFRDTLPDEYRESFDSAVTTVREGRTSELQSKWTEQHQKDAETRRRFDGKDEALQVGEFMLGLRETNPTLHAELQRVIASGRMGGGAEAPAGGRPQTGVQGAGQQGSGTMSDDELVREAQQMVEVNPANAWDAVSMLVKKQLEKRDSQHQEEMQQLGQAVQQQQMQTMVQQLRQQEAQYLAQNPMMQKYADEVTRRQNTETLPNGMGFWLLPVEQQYLAVAKPDVMTALAAQQQQQAGMPARHTANVAGAPQNASPAQRPPPGSLDEAWDRVKQKAAADQGTSLER